MKKIRIPFNKPFIVGKELDYIAESVQSGQISGDGYFTKKCQQLLEGRFGAGKTLLTTSCTAALEMAAILIDLQPGDEVILPSFTFVSTANAIILRGAIPRFAEIRPDTMNIDETKIEGLINRKTKAIFLVHYAGVGCEMDTILDIARRYNLYVVEDAAQGVNAKYKGKHLGTFGQFGCYSFHETKNFICGEGGALTINDKAFIERAEIIREKGTNRSQFFRGEVDKYTWMDIGSSYLPSDLLAAFLYAQFENMDKITDKRRKIFNFYNEKLIPFEQKDLIRLPFIPSECECNYHMFYLVLKDEATRNGLKDYLQNKGILAVFHYVPLHLSPMGHFFGYRQGDLPVTEDISHRLLRLPFYYELSEEEQNFIVQAIKEYFFPHNKLNKKEFLKRKNKLIDGES